MLHINGQAVPSESLGPMQDPSDPNNNLIGVRETLPGGKSVLTFDRTSGYGDDTEVFTVPAGHYFFMGDNRDNSLDSRVPPERQGVGMVPAENLVGKAQIILLSWHREAALFKPWTWVTEARPSRFFHLLK